jgi:hypothetical protein
MWVERVVMGLFFMAAMLVAACRDEDGGGSPDYCARPVTTSNR